MHQATKKRIEEEWSGANDFSKDAQDAQCGNFDDDDTVFLRTYANGMKVEVEEI